jgi:hypothetical protein
MTSTRGLPFSATVRVINRVHGNPSYMGPFAQPAISAGFADGYIFIIQVTDLTNCGLAVMKNHSYFAGWKFNLGVLSFFGH